jgi:hypothetical protein
MPIERCAVLRNAARKRSDGATKSRLAFTDGAARITWGAWRLLKVDRSSHAQYFCLRVMSFGKSVMPARSTLYPPNDDATKNMSTCAVNRAHHPLAFRGLTVSSAVVRSASDAAAASKSGLLATIARLCRGVAPVAAVLAPVAFTAVRAIAASRCFLVTLYTGV